ncbi:MAG: hypothetical protein U0869_17045 [Chloroflexota bacterium]
MRTRTLVLSTLLAASIVGMPAAAATATSPAGIVSPYTLSVTLWGCELQGDGVQASAFVNVSVRRKGSLLGQQKVQATGGGDYYADFCTSPKVQLRAGDTVTVLRTRVDQRTFTIPDIAPRIDVGKGKASGSTPPGTIALAPQNCWARSYCLPGIGLILNGGTWSHALAGDAGGGGDLLGVTWSGTGATVGEVVRVDMPVPYFAVRTGSSKVTGSGRPGQKVKVTVRTKGGKVRGTGTGRAKGPLGAFTIKVRSGGKAVTLRTGDRVSVSIYAGARLTVVPADIAVDAFTGHVTGHCFKDSAKVFVEARKGISSISQNLFTDVDGAFDLDASGLTLPLAPEVTGSAMCANSQGNELRLSAIVGT